MKTKRIWAIILPALCALVTWASVGGSISGVVTDSTGAVVPNARIVITNVDTAIQRTVESNGQGLYSVLALPVGRYQLTANAPNFGTYQRVDITLNTNDQLRINVVLAVGSVNQSVQVSSNPTHVETSNTQLGAVITSRQMEVLPLNGRQYTDLLALQPGVAPTASSQTPNYSQYFGSTETGSISVSGQRETANGFMVNGSVVNDILNNGTTVIPNMDSIDEFRILTSNFDAEYGNYSGGLVSVITKSGTDQFHGDLFEYLRNTDFDARSYFDIQRNVFQRNQFGGTIGGPILKKKVFFFSDYQGTRSNVGQSGTQVPVPSSADRTGNLTDIASTLTGVVVGGYWADVLSQELGYPVTAGENYYTPGCISSSACVFPNAAIPQSAFSQPAKALLKYIPAANQGSAFVSNQNTVHTRDDLFSGRVDVDTKTFGTISAYYFFDDIFIRTPFGTNNVPGFPSEDGGRSQLYTLSDTKVFSPTTLNELHLTYNRHVYHNGKPLAGFGTLASFGFNENQPGGIVSTALSEEGVPTIAFNSFSIGNPVVNYNRYENIPEVADNFSKVIGSHNLKFGGQWMFNDLAEPMPLVVADGSFGFNGAETGSDFADFLIGAPTSFSQAGGFYYDNRRNYFGLFGQDSWHVSRNLTFNYGLRWDVIQPWYEKHNHLATFVPGVQSKVFPGAPAGYIFPGDFVPGYGTVPRGISRTIFHNFAPRIGFAWAPSGGGRLDRFLGADKFSVRGGWGMFYQNGEGEQAIDQAAEAPYDVFYGAVLPPVFASPYTNRFDGAMHAPFPFDPQNFVWANALPLSSYPAPPINQKVPYTESYNLTLQRQFGQATVVTLGYLGNQAHRLLTQFANNPGDPELCLSLSQPSEVAPGSPTCGPFLENVVYTRSDGTVFNSTRKPFSDGNFGDNYSFDTNAWSAYNSLQVTVRHTGKRLYVLAGYTYSKSMDNASNMQGKTPNPLNPGLSYGLSDFDVTHNFVVSYSYLLPFDRLGGHEPNRLTSGWMIIGITHLATGFPVQMNETDDHSLLGNTENADTPDFLGGDLARQNPRKANVTTGIPYFNTALFAPSPIGHEGTSSRAFFHGPGFNSSDMSLVKNTKLSERINLQFRAEFFNVFNHAQFIAPSGNITAGPSAFGMITSAQPGRIGQLALKVLF